MDLDYEIPLISLEYKKFKKDNIGADKYHMHSFLEKFCLFE